MFLKSKIKYKYEAKKEEEEREEKIDPEEIKKKKCEEAIKLGKDWLSQHFHSDHTFYVLKIFFLMLESWKQLV